MPTQAPGGGPSAPASHAVESSPSLPPSLADKPAEPAQVTLHDGLLSIRADNSSLSQILNKLASSSGMTVDGFQKDQRVFGLYGPGNPRDILSSLLQDAGYNFLLVGTTGEGTPREVVLTARGNASAIPSQPSPETPSSDDDNNDGMMISTPDQGMPEQQPVPAAMAPGADNPNGRAKTPAEIIQELQRLRQQQQQNPQ